MKTRRQKSEEFPTTTDLTMQTRAAFENAGSDVDPIEISSETEAENEISDLERKLDKGVDWDEQQNAIIRLMGLINGGALQYEIFYKGLNRIALELIQTALDLRSALVKNACLCIAQIAMRVGQEIDLIGDFITPLIARVSHGTQIIAESSFYAIITIAKYCPSRRVMLSIFDISKSKGSAMKDCAAEALKLAIIRWNVDILAKYSKQIEETLSRLITDANSSVRQKARESLLALQDCLPKSADAVLAKCDARTKKAISEESYEKCYDRIGSAEKRKRAPSVASTSRMELSAREHRAPSLQPRRTATASSQQNKRTNNDLATTTAYQRPESRADDRSSTMSTPGASKRKEPLSARRQKGNDSKLSTEANPMKINKENDDDDKLFSRTAKSARSESVGAQRRPADSRRQQNSDSRFGFRRQEPENKPETKPETRPQARESPKTKTASSARNNSSKQVAESPRRPKTAAPEKPEIEIRTSDLSMFPKANPQPNPDQRPESRLSPRTKYAPREEEFATTLHGSRRKVEKTNFESKRKTDEGSDKLLEGEEPAFLETLQGDIDDGRVQELSSNISFVVGGCLQCCSSNSALISSQALTAMKSLVTAFPSYFSGAILEKLLDVLTEAITVGNPRSLAAAQNLFLTIPAALDVNEVLSTALKQVPSLAILQLIASLVNQGASVSTQRTAHRLLNHAFKTYNIGDVKDRNTAGSIVATVYKNNKEAVLRFIEGLRESQQSQFHDFVAPFVPELASRFETEIPSFSKKNFSQFVQKVEDLVKNADQWNNIKQKLLNELNQALLKAKDAEPIIRIIQNIFQTRGCDQFQIVVPGLLTQAHGPVNTKNVDAALRLAMKVLKPADVFDAVRVHMDSSDIGLAKAAIDFCTRSLPKMEKIDVESVVGPLINKLTTSFESPAPEVRKSVVMCFVELFIVLGKPEMESRTSHLSKAHQKLITIYYQRKTG